MMIITRKMADLITGSEVEMREVKEPRHTHDVFYAEQQGTEITKQDLERGIFEILRDCNCNASVLYFVYGFLYRTQYIEKPGSFDLTERTCQNLTSKECIEKR